MSFKFEFDNNAFRKNIEKQMLEVVRKKHTQIGRSMICPVHHQSVNIQFSGSSLGSHQTKMKFCCEEFKQKVLKQMDAK